MSVLWFFIAPAAPPRAVKNWRHQGGSKGTCPVAYQHPLSCPPGCGSQAPGQGAGWLPQGPHPSQLPAERKATHQGHRGGCWWARDVTTGRDATCGPRSARPGVFHAVLCLLEDPLLRVRGRPRGGGRFLEVLSFTALGCPPRCVPPAL